jgi:TM2 domain-containing membrane protein YozV
MDALLKKQTFTTQELQMLDSEFSKQKKSVSATWLLWVFLGGIGGHRYYLGKIGSGILMTLTVGLFGFWTLIDAFLITGMIRKENEKIEAEIIERIQTLRAARANDQVAASSP